MLVFILLLGFAVQNDQAVTLHYFFAYQWQTSLVVVLLCFFTIGVVVGLVAMLGTLLRQRRTLADAQRKIQLNNKLAEIDAQHPPANLAD